MRQVTKEDFYARIGPMNVTPVPRGRYTDSNYGSDFTTPDGRLVGMTVALGDSPEWKPSRNYFLAN